jgi:hypothetical protein
MARTNRIDYTSIGGHRIRCGVRIGSRSGYYLQLEPDVNARIMHSLIAECAARVRRLRSPLPRHATASLGPDRRRLPLFFQQRMIR